MLASISSPAAEKKFDFSELPEDRTPPGFRSAVMGEGKPGLWRMVMDEVPPLLAPLTPQAPVVTRRPVLAQLSQDPADEHFLLLIYQEETFSDFTLTTKFKTVRGEKEQMAGIAFRIQDETNYYVLRASSLGNTFRFYKVVGGIRGDVIGPEISIPHGVWHELGILCSGNQIHCLLDGKEAMPTLNDNTFTHGKIGFWTKSDSVSYFCDTRIVYTPKQQPAQTLVSQTITNFPRLLGLKVYVPGADSQSTRVVGSKSALDLGEPGGKSEQEVIATGQVYYGNEKGVVSVVMPLRDRNGDTIAAARVLLKALPGQTEQSALARAMPIVKQMQQQIQSLQDLVE